MKYAGRIDRLPAERAANVEVLSSPNRVPLTTPRDFTHALIEDVARKHGVTVEDIKGPRRHRNIVIARCEAIRRVSAARARLSYPELGLIFGGRDHTTIMYHVDKSGQGREECRCNQHIERYAGATNTNEGATAR